MLAAVDEAMSAVAETRDRVAGQVAIATFNMGIPLLAVPLMQQLSSQEPNLRVHVQQDTSTAALRLLRQSEVDMAITCRYDFLGPDPTGGLATVPLLFEPFVLLAPTQSHLRVRTHGLSALADEFWVTGPQNSGLDIAASHACESAGFAPQVKHRLIGAQNICELAATEVASAIVPRLSVPAKLEGLIVEGLALGGRTISAVVRAGRQRDPNISLILRTLQAIADRALTGQSTESLGVAS
ncbi:LysR substrate-binding domain-containing protein [Mycolicibacterium fortuitum]|uniref:LysR substrate-binding domain-containing protein n=2 Tax=Mycolicibacterium fortuitum TaxID=1766 RepID=A0AAE4VC95_MYCFO|nr:LysR substrate-binding domain-containing protein [Mycolicibacterium fortuitum]MDV7191271.1 LysR substrate-binding domain-containing protein [Mycolicibacterium fortuitum]MDV7205084.1 LysR substrate-binding domain-containing protein [Mycolicibacterium fortuitum]MDV7225380.1 LysR substrate-binding domain-containing protein [Mycolicibacterium fortuitum]MDV7258201.1 LysR substrate-binding domain-containing protein [Mycolicibacterium fortuitum]MDV7282603.1 LysR substrate-binding domain-containing